MSFHPKAGSVIGRAALVFLILLIAALSPALASAGALRVIVFVAADDGGPSDERLPGATVVLSEPNGQYPPTPLITDMNGEVLFPSVPVGSTYVVTVSMPGYATTVVDRVTIRTDRETIERVALSEELVEEVTVTDRRQVVELDQGTQSETEISEDLFADLPVVGRQYQNVLSVAAGVQDSDQDGNPNVHGSREQDFQMSVDGVSNVDPLTGEILSNINPDAIEEIEIIDSGADASFGGAIGGFGRINYKSGGNEFEGSALIYYSDSIFDNDGAGGRDPQDFRVVRPAIQLSGPIVRDKMWFLVSHELIRADIPIQLLGGPDFVQTQRGSTNLDQVTWQVTPKNQLQFSVGADPFEIEPAGVSSIAPPASGYILEGGGPTARLRWRNTYSATLFWESILAFSDIENNVSPFDPDSRNSCIPTGDAQLEPFFQNYCVDNALFGQRSGGFYLDREDQRERWTYRLDAEKFIGDWLGGSHRLRFGLSLERAAYQRAVSNEAILFNEDIPARGTGTIGSTSPRQFVTAFRAFPDAQTSTSRGNYLAGYITNNWQIRDNLNLSVGVRVSHEELESDGYVPIDAVGERAEYQAAVSQCISDRCGPNPRQGCVVSCTSGLTYLLTAHQLDNPALYPACSSSEVPNPDQCRRLQAASLFAAQAGTSLRFREEDRFTITNTDIAPRVSVNWDPFNDSKTLIAASYGRYYGNTFLAPLVQELGPDYTQQSFVITQDNRPDFGVAELAAFEINEIDRNLERQYSDEYALRIEREIAPETSLIARYVKREYRNQFQDTDINHQPVFWDELSDYDKFVLFGNGEETRCEQIGEFADCTGTLVNSFVGGPFGGSVLRDAPDGIPDLQVASPLFNNIYQISNLNESDYEAYILEINRRFFQNWEMRASYTWSESFGQAETFSSQLGNDATNTDDEKGPLATDQRHVVTVFGRVFVPRWGGFRLGGILQFESGLPYSIIESRTVIDFPTNLTGIETQRNTQAFRTNRIVFPTGQRNSLRNESFWTLNLNFQKEFDIKDVRATVQVNAYNVLNDDTQFIGAIQQQRTFDRDGEEIITRRPVATRRFGRTFELLLKANF